MEKEYIDAYLTCPYFDQSNNVWKGNVSTYCPMDGEYYVVKIPVPPSVLRKVGEVETEEPVKVTSLSK